MVISRKLLHWQTLYLVPRYNTISNDISFLDLELRSRSHVKVEGHRRGGVCVLWMLLVYFLSFFVCVCVCSCLSKIKDPFAAYFLDNIHISQLFNKNISIFIYSSFLYYDRRNMTLAPCLYLKISWTKKLYMSDKRKTY